jgi:hypothetical protein
LRTKTKVWNENTRRVLEMVLGVCENEGNFDSQDPHLIFPLCISWNFGKSFNSFGNEV